MRRQFPSPPLAGRRQGWGGRGFRKPERPSASGQRTPPPAPPRKNGRGDEAPRGPAARVLAHRRDFHLARSAFLSHVPLLGYEREAEQTRGQKPTGPVKVQSRTNETEEAPCPTNPSWTSPISAISNS